MVSQNLNASIPVSLLQSNCSHGACRTYALLSLLPTQNGRFWLSQGHLSTQLNCSTRHVRNFLTELEEFGFLKNTGDFHGQHRIYELLRESGTIVPQIKNLNLLVPENDAQSLLAQNPDWETEFQCFDGKEGRPSLLQKVEEAIARFSYGSLVCYVSYYLKTGAKWLLQSLVKVYHLRPEVQPASLEELQQERREQEAKRRAYNNRYMPKEIEQTDEDRSFIKEAFSRLTSLRTLGFPCYE